MVLMSRRGPLLLITGILRPPRHPLRVDAGVANRSAPARPASRGRLVCRRALPRGVRETAPSAPDRPCLARTAARRGTARPPPAPRTADHTRRERDHAAAAPDR